MAVSRFVRSLLAASSSVAVVLASIMLSDSPARAAAPEITVFSYGVVSEFPEGMRFSVEVESESEIKEIAVKFRIGTQPREVYGYMDIEQGSVVDSELFWRTGTTGRYIPPGTIIYYYFEIRDVDDNVLVTDTDEFIFEDARFTWQEVQEGPVAVAYHGPVKTRAEIVLDAITQTLEFMGPLLGADTTVPIRVTMYNNVKEMLEALPPGSATIRRELITEGQAFTNIGTLLVLGGGRLATGTASHEVTHILNHRAGDSAAGRVPSWLDEGLAEFGNIAPSFSYDIALEFAIGTGRLLPITSMPILPGDPEDVIIYYGEASSLIEFMVIAYGPGAMRELMTTLRSGVAMDDAISEIYSVSRIELENQWRDTIGAPHYVPPDRDSARPTPIPRPSLRLFSLTPQAGSETVASLDVTPKPTPEPPGPQSSPSPTPLPTDAPAIATSETTATPGVPEPPTRLEPEQSASGGGSTCGLPEDATAGLKDLAFPLMLLGLVGLGLRGRRR